MFHFPCQQMMDVSASLSREIIPFPPQEMAFILSMWNVETLDVCTPRTKLDLGRPDVFF